MMSGGSEEQGASGAGTAAAHTRCVIWHAPDLAPPERLIDALRRRGIDPGLTTARAVALAHLSRLHRDETVEVAIALLHEPERLDRPFELLQAMELYAPRAVAWLYREADDPQLRAVEDHDHDTLRALLPDAETMPETGTAPGLDDADQPGAMLRLVDPYRPAPPGAGGDPIDHDPSRDRPAGPPEDGHGPPRPQRAPGSPRAPQPGTSENPGDGPRGDRPRGTTDTSRESPPDTGDEPIGHAQPRDNWSHRRPRDRSDPYDRPGY
mgnify:CR=1 FL=1